MGEGEVVDTEIKLENLSPEEASKAVIHGYTHHTSNPLSTLSSAFEVGSGDQMVIVPGQDMSQKVNIGRLETQEAVKATAQAIINEVRKKACSRPYSHPGSTEPEKDWFAFTERLVAEKKDTKENAILARALTKVKVAWANLVDLAANDTQSITLPLQPGDSETNPFQFDFSRS